MIVFAMPTPVHGMKNKAFGVIKKVFAAEKTSSGSLFRTSEP